MSREHISREVSYPDGSDNQVHLDKLVEQRISRLPVSVRKYIRRLKAEGKNEEAILIRDKHLEIKRQKARREIAEEKLKETTDQILLEDNPNKSCLLAIRALWLMEAAGLIDSDQRKRGVLEIYEREDTDPDYLEKKWLDMEIEIRPLMPKGR